MLRFIQVSTEERRSMYIQEYGLIFHQLRFGFKYWKPPFWVNKVCWCNYSVHVCTNTAGRGCTHYFKQLRHLNGKPDSRAKHATGAKKTNKQRAAEVKLTWKQEFSKLHPKRRKSLDWAQSIPSFLVLPGGELDQDSCAVLEDGRQVWEWLSHLYGF